MVTRGVKRTPYQDPRVTVGPATIVIIPEYKDPLPETVERGICRCSPCTCAARYPDVLDPKLNAHSKLNDITACIQAYTAGADEALMLDPHGFVATCNSHALLHRAPGRGVDVDRRVLPRRHHPRATCCAVCREAGIPAFEKLQPDRCLRRRRGVRHRHLRRRRAGAHGRRTRRSATGRARTDGRRGCRRCTRDLVARDVAGRATADERCGCASRCGRARATSRPR